MSCGFLVDFFRCIVLYLFSAGTQLDKLSGFSYLSGVDAAQTVLALLNLTNTQPGERCSHPFLQPGLVWLVCVCVSSLLTVWGGLVILLDARASGCSKARGRNEPGLTPTKPPSMLLYGLRQDRILRLPSP